MRIKTVTNYCSAGRLISLCLFPLLLALHANAYDEMEDHQLGTQYSSLQQINKQNVGHLQKAWEFHTGDDPHAVKGLVAMEDQPSLIEGNLVVCSINRRLIALNPATGEKRWEFNPGNNVGKLRKCRGITSWIDQSAAAGDQCKTRIFLGTTDYRLLAIDAKTGKACEGFGDHGAVKMQPSKPELWPGEVVATSNPAVVKDVVVVGSSVADNQRVDAPSGRVLAFDARTGAARWQFDPIPRDPNDPAMATWGKGTTVSVRPISGVRWQSIRTSISFICPPPVPPAIFMAPIGQGTISTPLQLLLFAEPRARWFGINNWCTTISGITTFLHARC